MGGAHLAALARALESARCSQEILPDQLAPFLALFVAFLLAVGLDALFVAHRRPGSWLAAHRRAVTGAATALVAVLALVPVFVTFDLPLKVVPVGVPAYLREDAPALPSGTVLLTVPFAVSGSAAADVLAGDGGPALPAGRRRAQDRPMPQAARWVTARPARPGAS